MPVFRYIEAGRPGPEDTVFKGYKYTLQIGSQRFCLCQRILKILPEAFRVVHIHLPHSYTADNDIIVGLANETEVGNFCFRAAPFVLLQNRLEIFHMLVLFSNAFNILPFYIGYKEIADNRHIGIWHIDIARSGIIRDAA